MKYVASRKATVALLCTWLVGACLVSGSALSDPAGAAASIAEVGAGGGAVTPAPQNSLRFEAEPLIAASVSPQIYAPHFVSGHATESWRYLFSFPNGYVLIAEFRITNRGPGSGTGIAFGTIITPDGRSANLTNSRPRDRWSWQVDDDGIELNIADQSLDIRPPTLTVVVNHGRGSFSIEARSLTDMYRPGRLDYGNGKFYDMTILAPRLEAHGTVQLPGEEEVQLEGGFGIGVHSYSNLNEEEQAISSLRFDTFDDGLQLSIFEIIAPREKDYQRIRLLLLIEENRIAYHSYEHERQYTELHRDPEGSHYPIPQGLIFSDAREGESIEGEATLRQLYRLQPIDLINNMFLRFLLRRFVNPAIYHFAGDYGFRVDLGDGLRSIKGSGVATVHILDDPPTNF